MERLARVLEADPDGGQVVVTRFESRSLAGLLTILLLHLRLKYDVRRQARGFVTVKIHLDWRHRTLLSISLWRDLDSVYSMGDVPRHVSAVRLPGGLGVETACGVFCYMGDWRRVMFGGTPTSGSPLRPLRDHPRPTDDQRSPTCPFPPTADTP